jgi:hypothetical protein
VSGGRQGEEGGRQISSACSYPTAASAFSYSARVKSRPDPEPRVIAAARRRRENQVQFDQGEAQLIEKLSN